MAHTALDVSHQALGANKVLLLHFRLPKSHTQPCSPGGGTIKYDRLKRLLSTSTYVDLSLCNGTSEVILKNNNGKT